MFTIFTVFHYFSHQYDGISIQHNSKNISNPHSHRYFHGHHVHESITLTDEKYNRTFECCGNPIVWQFLQPLRPATARSSWTGTRDSPAPSLTGPEVHAWPAQTPTDKSETTFVIWTEGECDRQTVSRQPAYYDITVSCFYTSFVICGWHFLSLGGFACPGRRTESAWVGENGLPGNLKLLPVRVGPLVTLEAAVRVRQRIAGLFHSLHPLRRFCRRLNRSNYLVTLSFLPVSHGCQLDRCPVDGGNSRWTFCHRSRDYF